MGLVSRAVFTLAVAAPWLWLLAFAGLLVSATHALGRLPAYPNPDPKHLEPAEAFWLAGYYLAPAALISPILLLISQAFRRLMNLPLAPWRGVAFNVVGLALIVVFFLANPLGLASWYLD